MAACSASGSDSSIEAEVSTITPSASGRFLTYSKDSIFCTTPSSKTLKFVAWVLVGLALYWLYAGMGYRPLLLLQLLLFSAAAALLSAKLLLVAVDVKELTVLRYFARGMILVGAGLAGANLGAMLLTLWRRSRADAAVREPRP